LDLILFFKLQKKFHQLFFSFVLLTIVTAAPKSNLLPQVTLFAPQLAEESLDLDVATSDTQLPTLISAPYPLSSQISPNNRGFQQFARFYYPAQSIQQPVSKQNKGEQQVPAGNVVVQRNSRAEGITVTAPVFASPTQSVNSQQQQQLQLISNPQFFAQPISDPPYWNPQSTRMQPKTNPQTATSSPVYSIVPAPPMFKYNTQEAQQQQGTFAFAFDDLQPGSATASSNNYYQKPFRVQENPQVLLV